MNIFLMFADLFTTIYEVAMQSKCDYLAPGWTAGALQRQGYGATLATY
jgi:hypothetical protein